MPANTIWVSAVLRHNVVCLKLAWACSVICATQLVLCAPNRTRNHSDSMSMMEEYIAASRGSACFPSTEAQRHNLPQHQPRQRHARTTHHTKTRTRI
eukprot:6485194-Amphidinium_carterae.1